jgi:hypothetical protein
LKDLIAKIARNNQETLNKRDEEWKKVLQERELEWQQKLSIAQDAQFMSVDAIRKVDDAVRKVSEAVQRVDTALEIKKETESLSQLWYRLLPALLTI